MELVSKRYPEESVMSDKLKLKNKVAYVVLGGGVLGRKSNIRLRI